MAQSAGLVVGVAVLTTALLGLSAVSWSRRIESASEQRMTTTRSVTAADGTTTVVEEVTVIKDGHKTTSTTTRVLHGPNAAASGAPEAVVAKPVATDTAVALSGEALVREALIAHNRERKKVGVGELGWDGELAKFAQEWALHLCHGGKGPAALQHRPRGSGVPGENLWMAVSSETRAYPISEAVASWAGESRFFDTRTGRCRGGVCGHYTQLVWRQSTQVGCAAATCPTSGMGATLWVCNYSPAGNVIGEKPY